MRRRDRLQAEDKFVSPSTGAYLAVEEMPSKANRQTLQVVRHFPWGGGQSPAHIHFDFDETYEILDGIADARLETADLRLAPGETLFVPKGASHANPFGREAAGLTLRQKLAPATEGALAYLRTLAEIIRDGRDDCGDLPRLATLAVFEATSSRTYLSGLPVWPQRTLLLPAAAVLARRRGYEVFLPR